VGVALLLVILSAGVITQPSQLSVPIVAIWPLRLALVLLVALSWAFLMHPPPWLGRALLAFSIPTVLVLLLWGGPATAAQLFGWRLYVPVSNFAPFWLAVDTHGTLYATDVNGGLIWVFDSTGSPKGSLRPGKAPAVPTPGPGILPTGFEEELNLARTGILPTPTPISGTMGMVGYIPNFEFCGITTDPRDNLYTIDLVDPTGLKLLRFDHDGMITARWPVPEGYEPTSGCLAADTDHIYLSARDNRIFVLDHEANKQKVIQLQSQPFGISTAGDGKLLVMAPGQLTHIDVQSSKIVTTSLPSPAGELQIPMVVTSKGEVIVTNHGAGKLVRVDPLTGKVLGSIGEPGAWPGQFGDVGGLAQDASGRIYAADYRHRVIQRFDPDGKVDAIWWAARNAPEKGEGDYE
ncbi:MAG: PQQ-binding-like beta-propeller repeat protein, partial [Chloroflexia bacterium]